MSEAVEVLHRNFLPSLAQRVGAPLPENSIWFVLSEVSHGLEILHRRNHPHLWVCPLTAYCNKDDNWFVQDMHYWQGPDYQSNPHA
jgi:hypothetical protein